MNFVCIVFELGDKMLTLSSMENLIVQSNLKQSMWVPGLLGPKPFRPRTPRPKSIFLLGLLGPGLLGPVIK